MPPCCECERENGFPAGPGINWPGDVGCDRRLGGDPEGVLFEGAGTLIKGCWADRDGTRQS